MWLNSRFLQLSQCLDIVSNSDLKIKMEIIAKHGEKLYFCKTIVRKVWDGKAQGCFWDWEKSIFNNDY